MIFEVIRSNKRLAQVFLVLIAIPFAFWGIDFYMRGGDRGNTIVTVGSETITAPEFMQSVREQQAKLRQLLGSYYKQEMFDTTEMRQEMLEALINQKLMSIKSARHFLTVTDDLVREQISSEASFQENGKFSKKLYDDLLNARGLTPVKFEATLRRDLMLRQIGAGINDSSFVSKTAQNKWMQLNAQQREFRQIVIKPEQFQDFIKVSPEEMKAYYDKNLKEFEVPEEIRAEYVVLDVNSVAALSQADKEAAKAVFDKTMAEKNAARMKAQGILEEVKRSPNKFAEIAEKYSEDPGSAAKGGDLDFFNRGMMVKPFEEAAYRLKVNQISGLIESQFGYHIIKLTEISGDKRRASHILIKAPAAGVRPDEALRNIWKELEQQQASKKFPAAVEGFKNIVYEQPDSLKPAAEKFKLTIKQTDWFSKASAASLGVLSNDQLLVSLFSQDALKNRHNTEAIEVSPQTFVAARVLEYRPARTQSFEDVKQKIMSTLVREKGLIEAKKTGEKKLAELHKGNEEGANWGSPQTLSRRDQTRPGMTAELISKVFSADEKKLPVYFGIESKNGYSLYKVTRVIQRPITDNAEAEGERQQYQQLIVQQEFRGYLNSLREQYKVKIRENIFEKKEELETRN